MRSWEEFVAFVRGTRPRPPPGPKQPLVALLLAIAGLLHLPLVYLLVAAGDVPAGLTILVGLLSMGLSWSAGVSLEGRRVGTVRAIAAVGVGEFALVLLPRVAEALGNARWLLGLAALLCAVSATHLARAPRAAAQP